ncbi:MAG: hypothetical protein ACK524_12665, partial [Planctomyces sp.]
MLNRIWICSVLARQIPGQQDIPVAVLSSAVEFQQREQQYVSVELNFFNFGLLRVMSLCSYVW